MPEKKGRPSTDRSRAAASKERALAHLRWLQVREKRRELKRVVDFEVTLARVLGMIRDRMLALPDRLQDLTPRQRDTLRDEIAVTLRACSDAEL
ncbi:MAG: hypothetical protein WBY44_23025 [Bryobacteraceae bacterium]